MRFGGWESISRLVNKSLHLSNTWLTNWSERDIHQLAWLTWLEILSACIDVPNCLISLNILRMTVNAMSWFLTFSHFLATCGFSVIYFLICFLVWISWSSRSISFRLLFIVSSSTFKSFNVKSSYGFAGSLYLSLSKTFVELDTSRLTTILLRRFY